MKTNSQFGILGGGQLSMMLIQKAHALGILPAHLTPNSEDSACRVSHHFQLGDPRKQSDLKKFVSHLDFITFESEFYDAQYLKKQFQNVKAFVFPSLDCLALLQDRKSQKESFKRHKLLTSPFIHSNSAKDITVFFHLHKGLVAKQRFNGYDGYGTFILKTSQDLETFLENHSQNLDQFIFEKLISFRYEVAVQVARSRKGDIAFFPFVKTIQKDNKCFLVEGPEKPDLLAQAAIRKYLKEINYVGVMGFEFFKTSQGLVLNEVAPRVHNTGHHTLESCTVDQFTLHWLCAIQDKLPTIKLKTKAFVMLNLIGQSENEIQIPDRSEGALYWYGKKNRPGRKLGHLNFVGENKKALVAQALKELKRWLL